MQLWRGRKKAVWKNEKFEIYPAGWERRSWAMSTHLFLFPGAEKMRRRRKNAPLCAPFLLPKGRESLLPHLSHAKGKALFPRCSGNFLFHKPHSWLLGLRGFSCSGGVGCGENPAAPIMGRLPGAFFTQ